MAIAEGMHEAIDMPDAYKMQGQTVYNQNMQSNPNQIDMGMARSMNPRKTAYAANQHSISIIGSDNGRIHLPNNFSKPADQKPANEISGPGDKIPRSPPRAYEADHSPHKFNANPYNQQEESLVGLL